MLADKQLHDLQKKLKDRFYELREEVRLEMLNSGEQSYIELAGKVHDREEESVANMLVDLQFANIDRHIEEIRDIDAALIRIADRNYGTCCDCDAAIDEQRLMVYPTAKRCLACQSHYEKTHAQTGHSSL